MEDGGLGMEDAVLVDVGDEEEEPVHVHVQVEDGVGGVGGEAPMWTMEMDGF
jgi:hypothetical protein